VAKDTEKGHGPTNGTLLPSHLSCLYPLPTHQNGDNLV